MKQAILVCHLLLSSVIYALECGHPISETVLRQRAHIERQLHIEQLGNLIHSLETIRVDDERVENREQTVQRLRVTHPDHMHTLTVDWALQDQLPNSALAELYLLIHLFNSILKHTFRVPNHIELRLSRQTNAFDHPAFVRSGSEDKLSLIYRINSRDGSLKQKHPKYTWAIHAHEYGHLIFYLNLKQSSSIYRQFQGLPFVEKLMFGAERKWFLSEYLVESYDELFADLFSVLAFRDPSIMRKSISFSGDTYAKKQPIVYTARDFRIPMMPRGWNQYWYDSHIVLSPTRYHLYVYYLRQPYISLGRPDKALAMAFQAMALEIQTLMHKIYVQPYDNLPAQELIRRYLPTYLNQRLIHQIDMTMK